MRYLLVFLFLLAGFNSYADCDYSEADQNWGYGWDEDTQTSCPPLEVPATADFCDYTDAANNRGYGYNAATNESCPPLATNRFYSVLNSSMLNPSTGISTLLQQKRASCNFGDTATGGGCGFAPLGTVSTNGWLITGTTVIANPENSLDDTWICSFACSGSINDDGTHDVQNCPATPVSAKVLCVSNQ